MAAKIEIFTESLPEITLRDGKGLPVATIIPDGENFKVGDIIGVIGTPEDKFDLLDAGAYITGDKKVTIYMLINLIEDVKEAEAEVLKLRRDS